MNKKLTILIDMDQITVDLLSKWLRDYNKEHSQTMTKADIHDWDIEQCVPKEHNIIKYIMQSGYFLDLDPEEGAIDAIRWLSSKHDVYMVSAPCSNPESAKDKIRWIRKNLPFLDKDSYVLTKNKHLIKGDVFIDDSPSNISRYRYSWPLATILTVAYPYNKAIQDIVNLRAESYLDMANAWREMVFYIERLERGIIDSYCVFTAGKTIQEDSLVMCPGFMPPT